MEKLANYDITILVDHSGSMSTADAPGGKTRFAYAQESTEALARKAAQFDQDGITVGLFNSGVKLFPNTTPDAVSKIFAELEPMGGTDTAGALKAALAAKADKPQLIVIVTDGAPDDKAAVTRVITEAANNCTDNGSGDTDDLGILFLQVGNDAAATEFMRGLDDDLTSQGAKFDVVDAKTFEEIGNTPLIGVLLGALDD